jgi:hypothetical protein
MERRWKEDGKKKTKTKKKKENNEPAPSFKVPRRCPEAVDSAHRPSSDAMSRTPKGARPPPRANKQTHGDDAHAFVFFEPKLGDEPNKNSNPIVTPEGILLLLFFFARGGFFVFVFCLEEWWVVSCRCDDLFEAFVRTVAVEIFELFHSLADCCSRNDDHPRFGSREILFFFLNLRA